MKIFKKLKDKVFLSMQMFSLGSDIKSKLKLFFMPWVLFLKKVFKAGLELPIHVIVKKDGVKCNVYLDNVIDITMFKEIFIDDEYKVDSMESEPSVIFDLGSNIGLSVIYFKLKYPNSKIFAFEPDPNIFKKLKRNIDQFDDIYLFNLAVSDSSGVVEFFVYPNSSMSSSMTRRLPDQESIKVKSTTINQIMDDENINSIDLMKMDIEGEEYKAVSAIKNINKVKNFIGEVHLDLMKESEGDFLSLFDGFKTSIYWISKNRRFVLRAGRQSI